MADIVVNADTTGEQPEARPRVLVDILKPETCPPALRKFYSDAERATIAERVASGDIITELRDVRVRDKQKSGAEEKWPYVYYKALTPTGMTALARGRQKAAEDKPENYDKLSDNDKRRADLAARDGVADYFNYGFGLTMMQPIRVMLTNSLGGVDKEIAKQLAQVMKTGLFATEDAARTFIINQRREMGLEIPADETDAE